MKRLYVVLASGSCTLGGFLAAGYDQAGVESARLYGNINQYAYYFTDLLIGLPTPQRVSVIVDTGSSLCGFPCAGCHHCGQHIDPPFNKAASKSAQWVPCGAQCQGSCNRGRCTYVQSYTEGSSISGEWFQDEVRLGDMLQENPPVNATLGCHVDERKLFFTQRVNGIMGMAPHRNSGRPTILQDLFVDKKHINPNLFSMCLAEWGGKLSVGGWEPSYHLNSTAAQWIPLDSTGYYSIPLQRIVLNGKDLGVNVNMMGTALIDSGTTFTYFPAEVFNRLTAALVEFCNGVGGCSAHQEGPDCWRLDGGSTDPGQFPTLTLSFDGGAVVQWPSRAYLFQRGEPSLWCHAFADNGAEPDTVLGLSWMLHKDVLFDLERSRLGVADAQCPTYKKAPGEHMTSTASESRKYYLSVLGIFASLLCAVLATCCICHRKCWQFNKFCEDDEEDSLGGSICE